MDMNRRTARIGLLNFLHSCRNFRIGSGRSLALGEQTIVLCGLKMSFCNSLFVFPFFFLHPAFADDNRQAPSNCFQDLQFGVSVDIQSNFFVSSRRKPNDQDLIQDPASVMGDIGLPRGARAFVFYHQWALKRCLRSYSALGPTEVVPAVASLPSELEEAFSYWNWQPFRLQTPNERYRWHPFVRNKLVMGVEYISDNRNGASFIEPRIFLGRVKDLGNDYLLISEGVSKEGEERHLMLRDLASIYYWEPISRDSSLDYQTLNQRITVDFDREGLQSVINEVVMRNRARAMNMNLGMNGVLGNLERIESGIPSRKLRFQLLERRALFSNQLLPENQFDVDSGVVRPDTVNRFLGETLVIALMGGDKDRYDPEGEGKNTYIASSTRESKSPQISIVIGEVMRLRMNLSQKSYRSRTEESVKNGHSSYPVISLKTCDHDACLSRNIRVDAGQRMFILRLGKIN